MPEYPLKIFEELDSELLKLVENTREFALADGVLPRKFKLLIALALDAAHGAEGGVRALSQAALKPEQQRKRLQKLCELPATSVGPGAFTPLLMLSRDYASSLAKT